MKSIDKVLSNYFFYALPFIALGASLSFYFGANQISQDKGFAGDINDIFGWMLMSWIVTSLYLFIKMILSQSFRDLTLKKIVRLKESDERETFISGEAAKLSMLSTFALMILLLFLSCMTISVGKLQGGKELKEDRKHYISISFNPIHKSTTQRTPLDKNKLELFKYNGLPLPTSIVLFLIFCWQLGSFHLFVRREI